MLVRGEGESPSDLTGLGLFQKEAEELALSGFPIEIPRLFSFLGVIVFACGRVSPFRFVFDNDTPSVVFAEWQTEFDFAVERLDDFSR